MMTLPSDAAERKAIPLAQGLLFYFPDALAEVARVSKAGNDQHNPGQPMHHARGKSTDHADCIARHLIDSGTIDTDGQRHTAKLAWRALALLQEELEAAYGLPLPRNAKWSATPPRLGDVWVSPEMLKTYSGAPGADMTRNPRLGHRETYDPTIWREEPDGSMTNLSAFTSNGLPKERA